MAYLVDFGLWGRIFAVPTALVDEHLRFCTAGQLKVLLLLLREGEREIRPERLAHRLGLSGEDVSDALDYWTAAGIFEKTEEGRSSGAPAPESVPAGTVTEERMKDGHAVRTVRARPRLSPGEISDLLRGNPDFPALIEELEKTYRKVLSNTERETAAYLFRYLELGADVILMAAGHCVRDGRKSFRYLESVVTAWSDAGINTFEKAEAHLMRLSGKRSWESHLIRLFGLPDRKLTTREARAADHWRDELKPSDDLLRLAYDRTVDATGRVSFAYMDRLLTAWTRKGLLTAEEAEREPAPAGKGAAPAGRNASRSFDVGEAIRMMNENSSGERGDTHER